MARYTFQIRPSRKRVSVEANSTPEAKAAAEAKVAERAAQDRDVPVGWWLDLSTIEGT